MIRRFNFRHKIILNYFLLFCLVMVLAYPFIGKMTGAIVNHTLRANSQHLVDELKQMNNREEVVTFLRQAHGYFFFQITLFTGDGKTLYDSAYPEAFQPAEQNPDLVEQVKKGGIYSEGKSKIHEQTLVFVSLPFESHGESYILRTAIPAKQIQSLALQIAHWFFIGAFLSLIFLGVYVWLIFYRINYPIRQILKAIQPYQSGQIDHISPIELSDAIDERDDFYKLAETLNSLSQRLIKHIQQLVDERNEKEAILESLGEGVIAIDSSMHITYANFAGCRMLGISRKQLIGKTFSELVIKSKMGLIEKSRKLIETCQQMSMSLTDSIFLEEGKKIYLDLIAAPKQNHTGAILVLQDKSSHYKVLEMGKDFVANASHELRTPITIIRGFAETLYDMPELPREMVSDITEKIVRNCQRMDNLVKNLLTLADLENLPESRFQECDLIPLVENSKLVVNAIYEDAQIVLEKNRDNINVDADPDILELAIINLLDNAAKYSKSPAYITVKIEGLGEEARISISDRGIGIPPEDLEHIFERFYTVNKAHSRRLGGAGLGLSIVKTIVEKHHGTISVSSIINQGTTFFITLPLHPE